MCGHVVNTKGYFVLQKLALNIGIKAFWYINRYFSMKYMYETWKVMQS